MPAKVYYDSDANLDVLKGKKIAVIGYGSQGHAQAQNLRDSGLDVIVGQRKGSKNYDLAISHGFEPVDAVEAAKQAEFIQILIPDEVQPDLYDQIKDYVTEGKTIVFSHGFNIHFKQIIPPKNVDVIMIAPKGPGHLVRRVYEEGAGVPAVYAAYQDYSGHAKEKALAYAKGIGATRVGVIETTFQEETETDLFGEQAVLCGGVSHLIQAGFETLVEAGYQPEMAYFECMHEMKLIVDLFYQGGLSYMRYSVSNNAEYGDYTRGPRVITEETKKEMKQILKEIQNGQYAREFLLENSVNAPAFKRERAIHHEHLLEQVGKRLRKMMTWIDAKEF